MSSQFLLSIYKISVATHSYIYHKTQNFSKETLTNEAQNFDKQNFDEMIVGFIGETLGEKG